MKGTGKSPLRYFFALLGVLGERPFLFVVFLSRRRPSAKADVRFVAIYPICWGPTFARGLRCGGGPASRRGRLESPPSVISLREAEVREWGNGNSQGHAGLNFDFQKGHNHLEAL